MSLYEWLSLYSAAGFALLAWMAYLDRCSVREGFFCALLWPLTLVAVLLVDLVARAERRGWLLGLEFQCGRFAFGIRRRAVGTGWAVRVLCQELQVWKKGGAE